MRKWFSFVNKVIIGNKNMIATFTSKGELQRLYFPSKDNKQYINFPGKEDIACFEPTYAIEDFYKNMLRSLGKESVICKTILNFLLSHNYLYSYDEKCCINLFPEKYAF